MLWLAELAWDSERFAGQFLRDVCGCLLLLAILLALFLLSRQAFGMGDLKLLGVTALYRGAACAAVSFVYGLFAAAFVCVFLLLLKKKRRQDPIAFAPFLLAGYCMFLCR